MRLGIIPDAHLAPAGTRIASWHSRYEMAEPVTVYRFALRLCVERGADGVVLLGDISHSGDKESIETGVRLAAETGLRVEVVSGNHDCFERVDAVTEAVRRVGAENVRLATPAGEVLGEDNVRVAGVPVTSEDSGYTFRADGRPDVPVWGQEPVAWLSHYPVVSFAEEVSKAGLLYGDELEDLEEVVRPLIDRPGPTVVASGHVHLRHTAVAGPVLQFACAALVEPPFEVVFLDLERRGGRVSARKESVPLVPSLTSLTPAFSPPEQEWVFKGETWRGL